MPLLKSERAPVRAVETRLAHPAVVLAICYGCLLALHGSLLRLPYFWDEAGYYIPAARDFQLTGQLIPTTTISNAHPPLVMIYLAAAWKGFGYSPLVTRCAMLLVAAFALAGVFRLARQVSSKEVAVAATICTALHPVFFAQSSLAHIDLAAAALVIWGLTNHLRGRRVRAIIWFAVAALAKETAVLAPLALAAWELAGKAIAKDLVIRQKTRTTFALLLSLVPLAAWFGFHYSATGHVFGNPQFFEYNLGATLNPLRFAAALGTRLWQLFGYMNMFVLALATAMAMSLPPRVQKDSARRKAGGNGDPEWQPRRIDLRVQAVFAAIIVVHIVALSILGGAVLARYLLPVYPLVIIVGVSTLRRRLPWWPAFIAIVCIGFVIALVTEPPYRFAPEDNLAYADYVRLHQAADEYVEQRFADQRVLTAWPATDELMRPWLGYVQKPIQVLAVENFSVSQMLTAAEARSHYKVALLFSTKEEPRLLFRSAWWERVQTRFFGYHRDLTAREAAELLGGRIVFERHRRSQWVAVIRLETVENARAAMPPAIPPSGAPSEKSRETSFP